MLWFRVYTPPVGGTASGQQGKGKLVDMYILGSLSPLAARGTPGLGNEGFVEGERARKG